MAKRKGAGDWRAFLRALGRSGNVRVAACAAGMDVGTAYDRRIKDPRFAARWAVELEKGKARAAKDEARRAGGTGELVRRKTKHGDKLVRVGLGRWNAEAEACFRSTLRRTGCVSAAARACGFSTNALYKRRANYPEFAAAWAADEAFARGRLPGLLSAAAIASLDPEIEEEEMEGLPALSVDQAIRIAAMQRGGTGAGRSGADPDRRTATREETEAAVTAVLAKLARRVRARRLGEGWSEAADGTLVPPGWRYMGRNDEGDRRSRPDGWRGSHWRERPIEARPALRHRPHSPKKRASRGRPFSHSWGERGLRARSTAVESL